jgi:hypothetical protein
LTNIQEDDSDGSGNHHNRVRSMDTGRYDHAGLIVMEYANKRARALDLANLLLLEATPSGVVARPLKDRLEHSSARGVHLLVPLACPGEQRYVISGPDVDDDDPRGIASRAIQSAVVRTRQHVDHELEVFRDAYLAAEAQRDYGSMHSTVTLDGADDFLRDARFADHDAVRLRPGWRFRLKYFTISNSKQVLVATLLYDM